LQFKLAIQALVFCAISCIARPVASPLDKRIALLVGKGGVGRTSCACALALAAHSRGLRTLLLEIDYSAGTSHVALALGEADLTEVPRRAAAGMWLARLSAQEGHRRFLRDVLPGGRFVGAALRSRAVRAFLEAAPSFQEMGWYYHLLTLLDDAEYDRVFLDMPATGHALALTSLPEVLLRLVERGPVAEALRRGQGFLLNPAHTAAWVVTLPELLPATEALELLDGLRRCRVPVGGVLLNRYPDDRFDPTDRATLERLLARCATLPLGADAFRAPARADGVRQALAEKAQAPVLTLPELDGSLLSRLAVAIGGAPS
jgi:anion-transporting  ArsA/GET3 family ATPase